MNGKPILKEKDKPKKLRKKTTKQLKKELDSVFSKYIRLKYANKKGYSSCYTCNVSKPWQEMQCGHFISRVYLATRFDEDNTRVQCIGCNVFGGGKQVTFANKLDSEKTNTVQSLYRKAQEVIKNFPYQEKINHYTNEIARLHREQDNIIQ